MLNVRRSVGLVMTEATNIGARVVPALLVRDMAETLDFYGKLGFRLTGYYPKQSDPVWAEVQRDAVTLQFHTDAPSGTPPNPVCSGTFYLFPASVTGLAEELRGKVAFAWGPDVMDYGMREFAVQDRMATMTLHYLPTIFLSRLCLTLVPRTSGSKSIFHWC